MTLSKLFIFVIITALMAASSGCSSEKVSIGQVIKAGEAGSSLTVKITSRDGVLRDGANDLFLVFEDANGNTVDVEAASLNFNMPAMGTMPEMNDAATLTTTRQSGVYAAKVKLQMAGEWLAQIAYEGSAGKGKVVLPMTAQ